MKPEYKTALIAAIASVGIIFAFGLLFRYGRTDIAAPSQQQPSLKTLQ